GCEIADEGSGYGIGRAALGAVSRAYDGRSPRTALTHRVLGITRSTDFDAVVRLAARASPTHVLRRAGALGGERVPGGDRRSRSGGAPGGGPGRSPGTGDRGLRG